MPYPTLLTVLFACPLLLWAPPLHAQETDSSATDTVQTMVETDSLAADTTEAMSDSASASPAHETAKQEAQTAAEEWLSLTDAGKFEESWKAADSTLQKGISRKDWIIQGTRARNQLSDLQSRELTKTQYRDSTAQLSTGSPVVILQYASEFEGGSTLEAVIITKQDTTWKVAGYRVIPAPAPDSLEIGPDSSDDG